MIESSKVFNSHRPLGGILFCIFALLLFAIQDSIIKGLSGQYPILEILLLRSVIVFVLLVASGVFLQGVTILRGRNPLPLPATQSGILAALFQRWLWFSIGDICLILVTACLFSVALLCITQAYRIAIVSSVAPFEYSYLLWASIIGYLYFGDVPGIRTLVGGSLVVVSGCYIVYRERKEQDPSKS